MFPSSWKIGSSTKSTFFQKSEMPSLKVEPYTASIDCSLLKNLIFIGKFDTVAEGVDSAINLTSEHMKAYILSIAKKTGERNLYPAIIMQSLVGIFSQPISTTLKLVS